MNQPGSCEKKYHFRRHAVKAAVEDGIYEVSIGHEGYGAKRVPAFRAAYVPTFRTRHGRVFETRTPGRLVFPRDLK